MSIKIIKPGIFTTVQDLGRRGFARFGVNPNGAMDHAAARIANLLCGNDENAPLLEIHFPAAELEFTTDSLFAVCGADFSPTLGGVEIENWRPVTASAGARLRFKGRAAGNRAYLAVRGGLAASVWLGSASTNVAVREGGIEGRRLQAGDVIETITTPKLPGKTPPFSVSPTMIPRYSRFPTVRITRGGEFGCLTEESREMFLSEGFSVTTRSDRMGFRLYGRRLELREPHEMLSAAVGFGTIQLLPDGQTIVLMADHQTTGGYPRIGHVIAADLPLVGQLGPSDGIGFHEVSMSEAEAATIGAEADLAMLRTACTLFYGRM